MPKINVYVPTDMLTWLKENDIKVSAEFQARVEELRGTASEDGTPRKKIIRVRVRNGQVKVRPHAEAIGYVEEGGERYVVFME